MNVIDKFLELSQKAELLKKELKEVNVQLTEEMESLGVGTHFQDLDTKAVYEITEPTGTFITFKKISYNRTKLEGEAKGSLSMKKAKEMGYLL